MVCKWSESSERALDFTCVCVAFIESSIGTSLKTRVKSVMGIDDHLVSDLEM